MTIPVNNKRVERIVEDENSRLKSIHEGITEGILEGMKKGMVAGLKKGAKDGLKECLAGGLGNVSPVKIEEVLAEIGEDALKTTIRESTKNIFQKIAETYTREICDRVVNEVQKRHVKLTEDQIRYVVDLVKRSEQEASKRITDRLPDNPFVKEFAAGIQAALKESLEKELKSLEDRLKQEASSNS